MKSKTHVKLKVLSVACACALAIPVAYAQTLSNFVSEGHFSGQVRAYDFSRLYSSKTVSNQLAFGTSGMFNYVSPTFLDGFGVDFDFFTASDFGANGNQGSTVDTTLMGLNSQINALGQAYVQFAVPDMLTIRAGNQIINTPWINGSDSRLLPATYQGVTLKMSPVKGIFIYGLSFNNWKSRTSANYHNDNLYYPSTYDHDTMYGGGPAMGGNPPYTTGADAVGAGAKVAGLNASVWFYNFNQFARMYYTNDIYTLNAGSVKPFIGGQFMHETDSDSLLRYSGNGNVNASVEGGIIGVHLPHGKFLWGYDNNPFRSGAYGNGEIVSPYTASYATDPLYTTSMIHGLVELGPGHGWKAKFDYNVLSNKIHMGLAYGQYYTHSHGKVHDVYADLIYKPGGSLKGLSIRDRVEVANGHNQGKTGGQSFIYNRIMLAYAF